jgi:hypothetical protein
MLHAPGVSVRRGFPSFPRCLMPTNADAWNEVEHWRKMVRLVREYAAKKYGADVSGWTLRLANGRESIEPFPALTAEELLRGLP